MTSLSPCSDDDTRRVSGHHRAMSTWWRDVYEDLGRIDEATYQAISATPAPTLDPWLRRLSRSADRSALWVGVAAALAVFGGHGGRRAARDGLVSVAITSGVANLGLKPLHRRRRPDDTRVRTVPGRSVRMPRSASFPSGHSASAFAFATAAGAEIPPLALPLRLLAAAVAYSRVHGGAHYPGDAIAGSLVGGATATIVVHALRSR
jgi:membrane-associated phospholipid phosphatase